MGRIPPSIDLIEILYAEGQMTMRQVFAQVPDASEAWNAVGHLVKDRVAALWITEDGRVRQLSDWEVGAILRHRLAGSGETVPNDDSLTVHAGEKIDEAYRRDFGAWYHKEFGGA